MMERIYSKSRHMEREGEFEKYRGTG